MKFDVGTIPGMVIAVGEPGFALGKARLQQ